MFLCIWDGMNNKDHLIGQLTRCGGAPCSESTCHCPWGFSGPTCQQAVHLDHDVRVMMDHHEHIDEQVVSVARLVSHDMTWHDDAQVRLGGSSHLLFQLPPTTQHSLQQLVILMTIEKNHDNLDDGDDDADNMMMMISFPQPPNTHCSW